MIRYFRRMVRIYQGFVISGAILLFGTAAVLFAVIPGIRATRDLYDNLKVVEKETQALSGKLALLEGISEEDIRERLIILLSAVTPEKFVPTIFNTVEGLANLSGVSIADMSLMSPGSLATGAASRQSAAEKKIGVSSLPFSLNILGTYDQMRAFVGQINKVRRIFNISSFDLSIAPSGVVQVRLALAAFYQPLPTKVGSVQSPVSPLTQKEEATLVKVIQYPDMSQSTTESLTPLFFGGNRDPFAQ